MEDHAGEATDADATEDFCDPRAHDRFRSPLGWLEMTITQALLEPHLPAEGAVLDLASGAEGYAQWFAERDLEVTRAEPDVHERDFARGLPSAAAEVTDADVCDLSRWEDDTFAVTTALGPFHRLVGADEKDRATAEMVRVTRPGGLLAVTFLPRYLALRDLLLRGHDGAVLAGDPEVVRALLEHGRIPRVDPQVRGGRLVVDPSTVAPYFERRGVETVLLGSTHGFATGLETQVDAIRRIDRDLGAYEGVVDLLVKTATDPSILGLAGHLLYVGRVLD